MYLPEYKLPENVDVTADWRTALDDADIVVGVMPSAHAREVYGAMAPHLLRGAAIVSATKGLELHTSLRMSEVIRDVCGAEFGARDRGAIGSVVRARSCARRSDGGCDRIA